MSERTRQLALVAALLAVIVAGVAFDRVSEGVTAPSIPSSAPGGRFATKAVFCPPAPAKADVATKLAVSSTATEPLEVGIEPARENVIDLEPGRSFVQPVKDVGLNVVGYGAPVSATALSSYFSPVAGSGAGLCSPQASEQWIFPEGSSALRHDERLLIFNPFEDEAVVKVTFVTPSGELAPANLDDVAVPAGESVAVRVNNFVRARNVLSSELVAQRGRVVAWRTMAAEPEGLPDGIQFTLGAPRSAEAWYFPEGGLGEGFDERISIVNPSDEEALVTVTLITGEQTVQPPGLSEITVPARSSTRLSLEKSAGRKKDDGVGVSAIVQSTNGVEVVAGRTVYYSARDLEGVGSETGATTASAAWLLGPATAKPTTDSVVVMNPRPENASVSISLLQVNGPPLTPKELQDVTVPGGLRLKIPVGQFSAGRPLTALLRASSPVLAERFSFSEATGDVATVMGAVAD